MAWFGFDPKMDIQTLAPLNRSLLGHVRLIDVEPDRKSMSYGISSSKVPSPGPSFTEKVLSRERFSTFPVRRSPPTRHRTHGS
jgi:hypothetical protein